MSPITIGCKADAPLPRKVKVRTMMSVSFQTHRPCAKCAVKSHRGTTESTTTVHTITKRGKGSYSHNSLSFLRLVPKVCSTTRGHRHWDRSLPQARASSSFKKFRIDRDTLDSLQSLPGLRDCLTLHRGRLDNASWASAHSNKFEKLNLHHVKSVIVLLKMVSLASRAIWPHNDRA